MLPALEDQAEGLMARDICSGAEYRSAGTADLNDPRTAEVLQYLSNKGREATGQEYGEQGSPETEEDN